MTEQKRYVGTKVVLASPMTRAEYKDYRGWTLPADEDGADAGYLVEYMDGGRPNDSRHAGYISWSPEEVFVNAYRERPLTHGPAWLRRVSDEWADLDEKIGKLSAFLRSPNAHVATDSAAHDLLLAQHRAMLEYSDILARRMSLAGDDTYAAAVRAVHTEDAPQTAKPLPDPVEAEIVAKGLTAPRVTPTDIENNIASEHYFTGRQGALGALAADGVPATAYEQANAAPIGLGLLTICVLTLRNGFTVLGQSACASPENFDAGLGRKIARADAANKVWPLMGYALRERLWLESLED